MSVLEILVLIALVCVMLLLFNKDGLAKRFKAKPQTIPKKQVISDSTLESVANAIASKYSRNEAPTDYLLQLSRLNAGLTPYDLCLVQDMLELKMTADYHGETIQKQNEVIAMLHQQIKDIQKIPPALMGQSTPQSAAIGNNLTQEQMIRVLRKQADDANKAQFQQFGPGQVYQESQIQPLTNFDMQPGQVYPPSEEIYRQKTPTDNELASKYMTQVNPDLA